MTTKGSVGSMGGSMATSESTKRTAATRLLDLISVFGRGGGAFTLSELSRRADLSLPTTHRLVKELITWGGVEADESGKYHLTRKILELGSESTTEMQLRDRAVPYLITLHRKVGRTVHLAVRDGHDVMLLDSIRSWADFTGESRIGGRLPLHVTAVGNALLAYAGHEAIEDYLVSPLQRYTNNTICDPHSLRQFLHTVRQEGVAVTKEWLIAGRVAVAAPVFGQGGKVMAAVGIVCNSDQDNEKKFIPVVKAAAERIEVALNKDLPLPPDSRLADFQCRHRVNQTSLQRY